MLVRLKKFIIETISELVHKVKVPSYSDLQKYTVGAISISIFLALMVGLFNIFFRKMLSFIYSF